VTVHANTVPVISGKKHHVNGTELVEWPLMDTLSVDLGFQNAEVIFARLFGNVYSSRG
jgi:hypothetical protein